MCQGRENIDQSVFHGFKTGLAEGEWHSIDIQMRCGHLVGTCPCPYRRPESDRVPLLAAKHPRNLNDLGQHISYPDLPDLVRQHLTLLANRSHQAVTYLILYSVLVVRINSSVGWADNIMRQW